MTTQPLAGRAVPGTPSAPRVGWPLVGWSALAIGVLEGAILALEGTGEEGIRAVIRASARTSVLLFCAAFGASAWFRLRRDRAGRFLLLNRRYLGVSFAVSHFSHLAAIVALARVAPDVEFAPVTLVVGGLGYVFVAAMAATSFDASAAWLGPARWRRLHLVGGWYVWLVFVVSYVPRAVGEGTLLSLGASVLLLATAVARLAARRRVA